MCWWDSGRVRGLSASGSRLHAGWYLLTFVSLSAGADVQDDGWGRGGKRNAGSFPQTGIYYRLSHMLRVPRFFASLRMTSPAGKGPRSGIHIHRRRRYPPSEPFEPTRPSGRVKWRYHHPRRRRPMMPLERSEHNLLRSGHNLRGRRPRQPSPFEPSELSGPWGFSIALSASCFFSSLSVGRFI